MWDCDEPRTKMMCDKPPIYYCLTAAPPYFRFAMMCALHQRTQVRLLWIGFAFVILCPWSSSSAFQLPLSQLSSTAAGTTTRRPATTTMINQRDRRSFWALAAEPESQSQASSSTTTPTLEEQGVVELATTTTTTAATNNKAPVSAGTFLSQGEIDPANLKVDLSNPQQTRVILYIILSLIPVLFLIPLMLGSRELLPLIFASDDGAVLPPVDL
jgi:hypothetical protein